MCKRVVFLLLCIFCGSFVAGCKKDFPRKLHQWQQRKGLQLPISSQATHEIQPTLVVEVGQNGIWVEERLWQLVYSPHIRKRFRSRLTRRRLPIFMIRGKIFPEKKYNNRASSYMIPELVKYARQFATVEKEATKYAAALGQFSAFRGNVTLYLDRNLPFQTLKKVMYSLGYASYGRFFFASCHEQDKEDRCITKAYPVNVPKFGKGYQRTPVIEITPQGFRLTEGGLVTPNRRRLKHTIPKKQGEYNYKALTQYLATLKSKMDKSLEEEERRKFITRRKVLSHRKLSETLSESFLTDVSYLGFLLRQETAVFIGTKENMPIYLLFPVFEATQKTLQGKELFPCRILTKIQ